MGVILDSDLLIHLERNRGGVEGRISGREEERMFVSVISASELLHGALRAVDPAIRASREAFVERILSDFPILSINLATARAHARIWSWLASRGEMIGTNDSWIAAQCIAEGLTLLTRNISEFTRIPGLSVEKW